MRILERENERMNSKIREAVRQAEKMNSIKDEQDRRYQMMMDFKATQQWKVEQQKMKNQESKQRNLSKLANQKQSIKVAN